MPEYLQRLASAGVRIVPSRGARVTQRAAALATSAQKTARAEATVPSPPVAAVPISAGADAAAPRPAPSIGRLGKAPVGAGDTSRPASSAEKLEVARSRVESPAAVAVPPPVARQAKLEPPVASEPAPLSSAVADETPRHKPLTYDEISAGEADRELPRALPQMTVLTASELSPRKATRTPEQHLQRLPRIEAAPQASAKATPARSGSPPHPWAERIMPKLSEARSDLSLPPEQASVAPPVLEIAPQFQSTRPELRRQSSPAPAATPVGGLTIRRLEVQIVGRPRNQISEPPPAPVAPVGSAWGWPDRRYQERVW